jgi:hypothetical protein
MKRNPLVLSLYVMSFGMVILGVGAALGVIITHEAPGRGMLPVLYCMTGSMGTICAALLVTMSRRLNTLESKQNQRNSPSEAAK